MKTLFNLRKVSGLTLSIFIVTTLLLSIYFFVKIYKNEHELQNCGFGLLNQLSTAIQEKDKTIQDVLHNLSKQADKSSKGDNESNWDQILSIKGLKRQIQKNETDTIIYKSSGVYFGISYGDFLKLLLRDELFSQFLLIKRCDNDKLKYDSLVFSTFPFKIELKETDIYRAICKSHLNVSNFGNQLEKDTSALSSTIRAGIITKITIQGGKHELFLVPIKINSHSYYLGGLIDESKYIERKRNLDSTTVFIFILVLGIIIFSLPILKIFLIGPHEKLLRLNITTMGISLVAGVIVVVALATNIYIFCRSKQVIISQLKGLNSMVSKSFLDEAKGLILQMDDYDSQIKDLQKGSSIDSVLKRNDNFFPKFSSKFRTFFWVDSKGEQIMQISTRKNPGVLTNLSHREYVKNYDRWFWEEIRKNETIQYNVEPIFSNTSGEWLLAFSKPLKRENNTDKSNGVKLMAITANMCSLQDPVLPKGFEFCLVDKGGKVWYHSANIHYMNEDLVNSCNNNQRLAAVIHTGIKETLTTQIHGKTYYLHIQSIPNMPLLMVTMCDPLMFKLYSVQAIFFTFVSLLLIFALLLALYLTAKIIEYRDTNLAGSSFLFEWILYNKNNIDKYLSLIISNLLLTAVLLVFSLTGVYKKFLPDMVALIMTSITVLNFFFSFQYLKENNHNGKKLFYYIVILIFTLLFIDFIVWKLDSTPYSTPIHVICQIIICSIFLVPYIFRSKIIEWLEFLPTRIKGINLSDENKYLLFLFTWLAIAAIIPTFLLVKKSFKFEYRNYLTNQQIYLAHQINNRTNKIYDFYNKHIPVIKNDSIYSCVKMGRYLKFFENTDLGIDRAKKYILEQKKINKYFALSHYYYNFLLGEKEDVEINPQTIIGYNKNSLGSISTKYNHDTLVNKFQKSEIQKVIITKSDLSYFNPCKTGGYALSFWVVAFIFLILCFLLLRMLARKLFNFEQFSSTPEAIKDCFNQLENLKSSIIIVNINHEEVENICSEGSKCIEISKVDMKTITLDENNRLCVIGFGKNFENTDTTSKHLDVLEELLNRFPNRLAILMYTSPTLLIEIYHDLCENITDADESNAIGIQNLAHRIENLFSSLPVFYCTIEKGGNATNLPKEILKELEFDYFTHKLAPIISQYYNSKESHRNIENTILRVQEFATAHYTFLWKNLSYSEKFILFDLAQDTVMNTQNIEVIRSLIGKGILKCDDKITFRSLSFKNFILTIADKDELQAKQQKLIANGNWNRFKLPLMLLAVSIVVFLFATQVSFLSNLYTLVISLGTILGVFIKFSGMFKAEN